jgi:hypothetical protein
MTTLVPEAQAVSPEARYIAADPITTPPERISVLRDTDRGDSEESKDFTMLLLDEKWPDDRIR